MICNWIFPGLVFLSLVPLYLTLLIFLDCKISFCVWSTQMGRGRSGYAWALASVLLTALLFVFINGNWRNKSSPLPLLPSPTLLPIPLYQQQSPTCTYTKSQPFCFHQVSFIAGHVLKTWK